MIKKEKVKFIISKLDELYPTVEPPLNHSSNFTLLIAVLLSANSTDKSVNKVTPNLFKIANTPKKCYSSHMKIYIKSLNLVV